MYAIELRLTHWSISLNGPDFSWELVDRLVTEHNRALRIGRTETHRSVDLLINAVPVLLQTTFTPGRVTFETTYPSSPASTNHKAP